MAWHCEESISFPLGGTLEGIFYANTMSEYAMMHASQSLEGFGHA